MRRSSFSRLLRGLATAAVIAAPSAASAQGYYPSPNQPTSPQPSGPMQPMQPLDPNAPGGTPGAPGTPAMGGTHARLDEAEAEDSGRGFELFWLRAELGGAYTDMASLSSDTLQVENTGAGGPFFGLGAGVRFVVLTLGARLRYNALSSYNLWQINGELGLKFPIKDIDIFFGGHGGYSFVGSLGDAGLATSSDVPNAKDAVSIRGFNAGLDAGVDYYVSPTFSVGVGAFGDLLFLNRPPLERPQGLTPDQEAAIANDPLYQKSGTSAGLALGMALRLGLHFGL